MSIEKRIKEIKSALRMTSGEIAEKLNIPVRTIGSYERGEAQPGTKFLTAIIDVFNINVNWLLTGEGSMFLETTDIKDLSTINSIKDIFKLSDEEVNGLFELLKAEASRDMVLKFIQIKKGNKEALNSLIHNLQGIKAIYG